MSKKVVFVGLSGGVDSSVAALRLQAAGYSVVGVFIKVWHPEWMTCRWEEERLDAMRVAAHVGIPFMTCDAVDAYKTDVADYFIAEYLAGRTPNPDVMCNQHIKFGAFLDFAMQHGADFIATGHYAQKHTAGEVYTLHRGLDTNKDQSYFLWTLHQEQLARLLLPIGNSTKAAIRNEAAAAGLATAEKKDSQGICFLGHVDIPEFLSHYTTLTPGDVLDRTGSRIGTHSGALVYTVGQRHGFSIGATTSAAQPYYVTDRDIERNTITVDTEKPRQTADTMLKLQNVHWISEAPAEQSILFAQARYRQTPFKTKIVQVSSDRATLQPVESIEGTGSGQSCVLYDGDTCVGGGIIA